MDLVAARTAQQFSGDCPASLRIVSFRRQSAFLCPRALDEYRAPTGHSYRLAVGPVFAAGLESVGPETDNPPQGGEQSIRLLAKTERDFQTQSA